MSGLRLATAKPATKAEESDAKRGRFFAESVEKTLPKMDKPMKSLIVSMQKLLLKTAQENRDHASAIFDTAIGLASNPEVAVAKEEGTSYNKETFGKSGHNMGPPFIWIFGGWFDDLLRQLKEIEAPTPQQDDLRKCTQQAAEQYGALDVEGKAEVLKFFRLTSTYKKRNQPEGIRITLCCAPHPEGQALRRLVLRLLKEQAGFEMKIGRAPPGHLEREIQEW
jgi:hypothetical protein